MSDRVRQPLVESVESRILLASCCDAFWSHYQRWPKDYAELSTFVQQSDGKLELGHYDYVDFTDSQDGSLEVCTVCEGFTYRMTIAKPEDK